MHVELIYLCPRCRVGRRELVYPMIAELINPHMRLLKFFSVQLLCNFSQKSHYFMDSAHISDASKVITCFYLDYRFWHKTLNNVNIYHASNNFTSAVFRRISVARRLCLDEHKSDVGSIMKKFSFCWVITRISTLFV